VERLGDVLLSENLIQEEDLKKALMRQKSTGGRLGTNLVEMMLIDDVHLGEILAQQLGVPSVHPKVLESIDRDVLDTLSVNLVEYFYAVPFKLDGQRLHCAMPDASNVELVDDLSHRSGYIIKPYICAESVIFRALSIHYRIPTPVRHGEDEDAGLSNEIVHDNSGLISLDEGQYTLVDRTDILGQHTKKLFLESSTKTAVVGYFLQFLGYNTDKVAFLAYDSDKNYLWRDAREFQAGRKGIACGETVNRSKFWQRYLTRPSFFYTRLPHSNAEAMNWVNPLLDLPSVKAVFLAPLNVSKRVIGVAIGGSNAAIRLEEELETVKKLHLMAVSALKIQEFRKIIDMIS
jgi:MshEN domain